MKSLIISVFALIPTLAFACPDLSGTYSCPASGDEPANTTTISNSVANGVVVYSTHSVDTNGKADDSQIVTDGVARQEQGENGVSTITTNTCEGDSAVRVDIQIAMPNNGGTAYAVARAGLDSQRNLRVTTDVTGLPNGPTHSDATCVRK